MTYLIGVDDAGKGPVLGPMILAGVLIEKNREHELKELGAKDSKLLNDKIRNKLGNEIKFKYIYHTEKSLPEEIDSCKNLNSLEAQKVAIIINKLAENIEGEIIAIVDCPSPNIKAWSEYLATFIIKKTIKIQAEHKADFNHPVVSAASIIAKEQREEEIAKLKQDLQVDFGSGYSSDPKTIDFIQKNHSDPLFAKIIRHSWQTVQRLKVKQETLF
jgi:ribonuclease HII